MATTLESMYTKHHADNQRGGFSIMEKERGELLRSNIGVGKRILDIGCRDGVLTATYAPNNTVVGVDIDGEALARAKANLGIETMQFDLLTDWPVPPRSFDVIVAGEVIEHLFHPRAVVERAAKALKQDGLLIGSVPNAFSLINRFRLFLGKKKNTPLKDPTHVNHFTRQEMIEILREQFKEVRIHPLGRFAFLDPLWPGMFSFDLFFEARRPKGV